MTTPSSFPRCAEGTTIRDACVGMVDDLHAQWELPSVYLLIEGRLRCQASRGYFQVSDGGGLGTGVIGRAIANGEPVVIEDATLDPEFISAIPGLRAEVCVPFQVNGTWAGAINLESLTTLSDDALPWAQAAADALGSRLSELGGLPPPSLAERLGQIAIGISSQTDVADVKSRAVEGARDLSGMSTAALARSTPDGWQVTCAIGPLAEVLQAWDHDSLSILSQWVWAGTSSYFPDGEQVPSGYDFLTGGIHALSVQPLVVTGEVTGLLITADTRSVAHDPALSSAMELLASQTAATLAMTATVRHLAHLANHDPLTGLSNRRALLEALEQDLEGDSRSALVLIDLDGFKQVNDQHGHAAGDALLIAVARRLLASARQRDLVVRLGGDEFAVLLRSVPSLDFAEAAARRFLDAVTQGGAGGWHGAVGASAGVRLVEGDSPSTVLVDADAALYAAKNAGRGQSVLWDARLRQDKQADDELVADLRTALERAELTLVYQPVVDIGTLAVLGLEALARWEHPVRGTVPPSVFVDAAERHGLVPELTRWVLRTVCEQALLWDDRINVGLNISAAQIGDEGIVKDVEQVLLETGLRRNRIVLEVTETFAVQDLATAKRTLEQLEGLGVTLALDDFGTGYSSLTHAQELPFDILKIDRSFVAAAATEDRRALATIAAVCALASRLQVDVVAEGVEDQGQLTDLIELGVAFAQGFGLSRPLTAGQVTAALDDGPWYVERSAERALLG